MQITQEEKVHVAVTKREEPPRARGTWSHCIHRMLSWPCSLYHAHWLRCWLLSLLHALFYVGNNDHVRSFMFELLWNDYLSVVWMRGQVFKVKSVFKVPGEPKRAVPEEKVLKHKPKKEEAPPATGTPTLSEIEISI